MTGLGGIDLAIVLAFTLLVGGVVGSLVPGLPGALLSLVGVAIYWWSTGYADPGTVTLVALTLAGLFAVAFDWLGGALAARAGGGSTRSMVAAGAVGFLLFFVAGPLGVLVGVAGTVFASEYLAGESAAKSLRTAAVATAGVLASAVVQVLITGAILLAMVLVVLL